MTLCNSDTMLPRGNHETVSIIYHSFPGSSIFFLGGTARKALYNLNHIQNCKAGPNHHQQAQHQRCHLFDDALVQAIPAVAFVYGEAVIIVAVVTVLGRWLGFLSFFRPSFGFYRLFFLFFSLTGFSTMLSGRDFPHSGQKDTALSRRDAPQ